MGLGAIDSCLIAEELAFGCAGIKAAIATSSIGVSQEPRKIFALTSFRDGSFHGILLSFQLLMNYLYY